MGYHNNKEFVLRGNHQQIQGEGGSSKSDNQNKILSISLPKGGGAIRGIGEKFAENPVTGSDSMSVPITTSPGRSGFGSQLQLSNETGSGNGSFGIVWNFSLLLFTCKTEKAYTKIDDVLRAGQTGFIKIPDTFYQL